jgi:methyl-accepting chemotaxis protein
MNNYVSRFKTLKTKIIAMLIIFSMIPVLITGIISYEKSKRILNEKLETTSSQTIHEITRGLNYYFSAMSDLAVLLAIDTNIKEANNSVYFEFAKGLLANVKATDENIVNVFVGTETGMFYTDPYAEIPEGFDHRTRGWYTSTINNPNEIFISDPYVDTASGRIVVSISSAIMNNDLLIGVVGIDINLAALSKSLSDIKIGDSGYIFITDQNGILIAHQDASLIGTDITTTLSLWEDVKSNKNGFTTYDFNGEDRFASYETNELTGWKIIATMNYSELSDDTKSIKTLI